MQFEGIIKYRGVAQVVARLTGGQEVASSSLVTPTRTKRLSERIVSFNFFLRPIDPGGQVSEPTASCGRLREAEKKKNKEYHEALQASETTIFSLVVASSSLVTPTRTKRLSERIVSFNFFLRPIDPGGQVSEPTASCGRLREAEKKKNKEYHEALQASETTIFFLVVASSSLVTPTIVSIHNTSEYSLFFFYISS